MFKIEQSDIGMFLGGLFSHVVYEAMLRITDDTGREAKDWPDEELNAAKPQLAEMAFDAVVDRFAEPLKSKLRADKTTFIAHVLKLN